MKRILMMMAAVFALAVACEKPGADPEQENAELTIEADKLEIIADGTDYAQITAKYGSKELTDGLGFYDASTNVPVSVKSMHFTTRTPGQHNFYATYNGKKSNVLSINALEYAVPAVPADTDPSNTSFRKRVFLTQFTSTGCTFCPTVVSMLRELSRDSVYSEKFVLAASHADMSEGPYADDPASFPGVMNFMTAFGVMGFPTLSADFGDILGAYNISVLKALVDGYYGNGIASAGLAVNSEVQDNVLVARTAVKAGEAGNYRVGAMLLEDGIYGKQTSAPDESYNTHDNCIRIIDAGTTYMGHSVGKLSAGNVAEHIFTFRNIDSDWNLDKCKMLFYVTSSVGNIQVVNNAIVVPLGKSAGFEYK